MTPLKASLYKTARIASDDLVGFTRGQCVGVRYLGIAYNDEPVFAVCATTGGRETLVEASLLEVFVL